MDSLTIVAVASISIAGITIGIGVIAPALGEGRAVSTALTSLAQQPERLPNYHPDIVRGPCNDRVTGNILFRGLD